MKWSQVIAKEEIFLNLGGADNHHPKDHYNDYISIDKKRRLFCGDWSVKHDLRERTPIQDGLVTRILSEDFFEHMTQPEIQAIIEEGYRILKPDGMIRIGVPDYNNPKDRPFLLEGKDPRYPQHLTLTTYGLMKHIIEESPFLNFEFYHYWNKGEFIRKQIDYSLGWISRTPDNDPRCKRQGNELQVTSLVVDMFR